MRNTLLLLGLAAGLSLGFGLACRRGHLVKCYREFVVGPYRCHWYPL
jgi:hypothetical protein